MATSEGARRRCRDANEKRVRTARDRAVDTSDEWMPKNIDFKGFWGRSVLPSASEDDSGLLLQNESDGSREGSFAALH